MSMFPSTSHLRDKEEDFGASVPTMPDEHQIKVSRRERLFVFWEPNDWGLWTSPNARFLRKPVHRPDIDHDNGLIQDYCRRPRKTRWLQSLQPFLAFWPLHVEWTGPFASLRLIPGRVPVHMHRQSKYWQLHADVIEAWQALEGKLYNLATGLLRRHITAPYDWSEIRVSILPYECGYQQFHGTVMAATGSAYASRNAFLSLSSFVSFVIALDLSKHPFEPGTTPDWLAYASSTLHMDPVWLSEINESFICNFTPGFRPGAYVHASSTTYKETFPAFKAGNVPLYICWGFRPRPMAPEDHAWRYRPCQIEAKRAIDEYCDRLPPADDPRLSIAYWYNPNLPNPNPNPSPSPRPRLSHEHPPPQSPAQQSRSPSPPLVPTVLGLPEEDSPQSPPAYVQENMLDWESWGGDPQRMGPSVFLARLAKERLDEMKEETGEAAERREVAERTADRDRLDTTSERPTVGTAVYVWAELGDHSYTQRAIPVDEWSTVWPLYAPDERHFSLDYNEWNLVRNRDVFVAEEEQFPDDPRSRSHPPPELPSTTSEFDASRQMEASSTTETDDIVGLWKREYSTVDAASYEDDSSDDYESDDSGRRNRNRNRKGKRKGKGKQASANKRAGPFDNRNQPHLMLVAEPSHHSAPPATAIHSSRIEFPGAKELLRVKFMFSMPEPYATHPQMQVPDQEGVQRNVGTVQRRMHMLATVPEQDVQRCLVDLYNYIVIVKAEPAVFSPLWDFAPTRRRDIVNHAYFFYHRVSDDCHIVGIHGKRLVDQWYLLVIHDARAVVEVFRQGLGSIGEMVRYLINNGIPFATGKPVKRLPQQPNRSHTGLGYRPSNYSFSLHDYAHYEQKKRELLSGPAGRAALSRGGIVWRLAYEIVKHRKVTEGPTSTAVWYGRKVGELDGHMLVDDQLTQAEEDTLCGVYKQYTKQPKGQTADASWFPKSNVWDTSAHNPGYWSVDNETWFQRRLEEIRNGAQPRGSNEWRRVLTGDRPGPIVKIRKWMGKASDLFLQGDTSVWVG